MSQTFDVPPGLVAVTTYGALQAECARSIWDAKSATEQHGIKNLGWTTVNGALVDKARNDACRLMLRQQQGFVLFIDADMTFAPDSVIKLLQTAYGTHPWADVVGGYCNLRGEIAIPTIDTGTGTWESHYPNSGVLEVIRTGGAFLLIKRHVCERLPDPWFALRVPMRPIDAMAELDNFARIKFDGTNPFRSLPEWQILETIASQEVRGPFVPAEVGEDSGFCDKVKAAGMRIVVDTSVVTGHLHQIALGAEDHKKAMAKRDQEHRYAAGLL